VLARSAALCALISGAFIVQHHFPAVSVASAQTAAPDQMVLEADQLLYRRAEDEVEAVGGVDITYQGNRLVAERVIYKRTTGRVVAIGNVQLFDGSENELTADRIDVTDDFSQGFVDAVELRAPAYGRFAAVRGERVSQTRTEFTDGSYIPCRVCDTSDDKPPLWSVKAKTIIIDETQETVVYRDATFALFGQPIVTVPYFRHADPRVERSTGFLRPKFGLSSKLGPSVAVPYFMVLSPTTDLTLTGQINAFQGLLMDAEWRQAFGSGYYTLRAAGTYQLAPTLFDLGSVDRNQNWRGLVASKGRFKPGDKWAFEWNLMAQTDTTFGSTYSLEDYKQRVVTNNISLTGLEGSSYFDLSAFSYLVQDNITFQKEQGFALPRFIYERELASGPYGTAQLKLNGTNIYREAEDSFAVPGDTKFEGIEGLSSRFSAEFLWSSKFSAGGLVFKPLFSARGDFYSFNTNSAAGLTNDGSGAIGMVTAGAEVSYPIFIQTEDSTHIVEPKAQILVRPNEMRAGRLPNNDAQSIVFDSTSLFEVDKFTGQDRMEGGTRLNYGLLYTGTFTNGLTLAGTIGQSVHLAGVNSFSRLDAANSTSGSGLERNLSDVVAGVNLSYRNAVSLDVRGRFDQKNAGLRRLETIGSAAFEDGDISIGYAFVDAQPQIGFLEDRHEISFGGKANLDDNWVIGGGATFNLHHGELLRSNALLGYEADAGYIGVNFAREEESFSSVGSSTSIDLELRLFPFD
jgi:LPS-assembly protein